jgi:predicted adenylyl cyclase CyaB
MKLTNFEFKARLRNAPHLRGVLKKMRARFVGRDHQVDTYFHVSKGRLKLRQGNLENALIFYDRSNVPRARRATIELMPLPKRNPLRSLLASALGVRAVVEKWREIYFVGNVKIHLDHVRGLGRFVEVEAISKSRRTAKIRQEARKFLKFFRIAPADLIAESYADLVGKTRAKTESSRAGSP